MLTMNKISVSLYCHIARGFPSKRVIDVEIVPSDNDDNDENDENESNYNNINSKNNNNDKTNVAI